MPRGNPIEGLAPHQAATQEAWEEAGIKGAVEADPIGRYSYCKRRAAGDVPAEVELYVMAVTEEHDDWPEASERTRRWFPPEEAATAVDESELGELILAAGRRPFLS